MLSLRISKIVNWEIALVVVVVFQEYKLHTDVHRQKPTWLTGVLPSLGPENENQGANILMQILQSPRKPGWVQYWHCSSSDSDNKWRHSHPRTSWERHFGEPFCEHTGQQMHISYFMFYSQLNSLRIHTRISLSCQCILRLVVRPGL